MNLFEIFMKFDWFINQYTNYELFFWIKTDKLVHAIWIFIIAYVFYIILKSKRTKKLRKALKIKKKYIMYIVLFIVTFISFWKEIFDEFYKNTFFSIWDLIADYFGYVVFLLIIKIRNK